MFVIVTYDVATVRVSKVMKICRKYLKHKQRSVFEGMITNAQLEKMKMEIFRIIDTTEDRICIYKLESLRYTSKEELGVVQLDSNIF